jgi:DNA-binding response OmpR family regulator
MYCPEYSSNSKHNRKHGSNSCVMVVDDHEPMRQLLQLALETAGFQVVGAATEFDLQRQLVHSSPTVKPDALVLNVQRSEVDGLGILSRLRAYRILDAVPIVFLAGCEDDYLRLQALSAGADWFALRPLGMLELQGKVAELIREGRSHSPTDRVHRRPIPIRVLKRTG